MSHVPRNAGDGPDEVFGRDHVVVCCTVVLHRTVKHYRTVKVWPLTDALFTIYTCFTIR